MTWLEHRIPPPLVGLAAGGMMWGLDRLFASLRYPLPGNEIMALALGALGVAVDVAGMLEFRKARTTLNPLQPDKASTLVAGGIFRRTRNPMYLGMALLLSAWAVYLANLLGLLGIAFFVAYLNRFQIAPEERSLEQRFGAEFRAYRETVRRWL